MFGSYYRNQSIDLQGIPIDSFFYHRNINREKKTNENKNKNENGF